MFAYIVRKLLSTVPTIFGVTLFIFILFNVVGGDPALMMAGKHASAAQLAEIRHQYFLDLSLPMQYLHYLKEVVTFDYGRSFLTKQPVSDMILSGVGPSAALMIPSFLLLTFIAVAIGLVVAYFRGKLIDRVMVVFCVFGMSLSILAYIIFCQYLFAFKMGLFPISGYESDWADRFNYVALPGLIYVIVSLGYDVRFYRTAILEETNQDYVRTARAKGLSEPRVFFKHVLKNSMTPILTNIMLELPLLIMGMFLLESFFSIPGLGGMTINAVENSDFPVIKAMATLQAFLLIAGNLVNDILYTVVDPRVSLK